jgi:hypothetical protein
VKVGETALLGRRVVVLERSSAPYEQTVKMWVDPVSMMVLRHESNVGRWVAEVTRFDPNPKLDGALFRFTPPPGAVDRKAAPGTTPRPAVVPHGNETPSGFYEPRPLLSGLQPRDVGIETDDSGVLSYRSDYRLGPASEVTVLTFEQRAASGPLPAVLTAGERLSINGHTAFFSLAGNESRLAWSDGTHWLLLTTTQLSREDLLQFAGTLEQVP